MAKRDISRAQSATKTATGIAQQYGTQYGTEAGAGYQDFATTGGVTPQEQALTRQRTARGIGSLYDSMRRNLEQRKRIQGGYSPGYGANVRALSRQAAGDIGAGVSDTELGLLQQIRSGRLAGLGGLGNLAALYQGQIPSLLGIQGKLAIAKPGLAQQIGDWASTVGGIGSAIAGGFGGFGGGGGGGGWGGTSFGQLG